MVEADPHVRVRLDLSYDGTQFSGWALQPGRRTVQGVLQDALATVLRVPSVALTVAGRTDAGVHARGQVAHADLPEPPDPNVVTRLAGVLPPDVRVRSTQPAPAGFDARFGAVWRRYEYRISDEPTGVDPVRRWFVDDHRRPLDSALMAEAAQQLLGLHDYAAFCRRTEFGTTIRTVQQFTVARDDTGEIVVSIRADAFCQSMVRSLVGALLAVGERRHTPDWPASLLGAAERSSRITVAPPQGLTLVEVGYPPDAELAARAEVTRARRTGLAP
ncbi:MAG TPA: tRNA pseudouridine(38-40) synthase TruA [Jatrophihabitans sp.]|jgi:tRNA pseudouridine38-40 synthase